MKSEWKKVPIKDLCVGIYDGPHATPPKSDSGAIFLGISNLSNGSLDLSNIRYISENDLPRWTKRVTPKAHDIVFSYEATLNLYAIIPEGFHGCLGRRMALMRPDETKVNYKFLYYYMFSSEWREEIERHRVIGSTVDRIPLVSFPSFIVNLPDIATQQVIADTLSALDEKIELNNKINDNLDQQAQTVFTDWFVSFSPFANEDFVTSPIGTKIPATLKMMQIANIPHLLETGKRPKGGAASYGIPSVGAENVKQLGKFDFSSNKYIPVEFAKKQKTGKISGYELLLYKDGGRPGTFIPHFSMFGEGFPYKEFFINEHVFKLDFFDHGKNEFAYFYMQTDYAMSWLANNGGKAAIPGINKQNVQDIWIYDMEHPKVKQFCSLVQPFFKAIFRNCNENVRLANLRDTLIPKLMSGEIKLEQI